MLSAIEELEQKADEFIEACHRVAEDPHPSRFGDAVVPDVLETVSTDVLAAIRRLAGVADRSFGSWARTSALPTNEEVTTDAPHPEQQGEAEGPLSRGRSARPA